MAGFFKESFTNLDVIQDKVGYQESLIQRLVDYLSSGGRNDKQQINFLVNCSLRNVAEIIQLAYTPIDEHNLQRAIEAGIYFGEYPDPIVKVAEFYAVEWEAAHPKEKEANPDKKKIVNADA